MSTMRPILMIENIADLHDARYCAAVGIGILSFEIDGSDTSKHSPSALREIAEWLSGVEIYVKAEHMSTLEQEELVLTAGIAGIVKEHASIEGTSTRPQYIIDLSRHGMDTFLNLVPEALAEGGGSCYLVTPLQFEALSHPNANHPYLERCIVRYSDLNSLARALETERPQPKGISLGVFSNVNGGQLDYDACDTFLQSYELAFT